MTHATIEDQAPLIEKDFMFRKDINYGSSIYNFTIAVNALSENKNMRVMCLVPHSDR